jgi:hypothetical protein
MNINEAPKVITLKCNVTGIEVKWTNQANIAKKIQQYGSLEAFQKAYVSRGASKPTKTVSVAREETNENEVTRADGLSRYVTRIYHDAKGHPCTVRAPRTSGDTAAGR